MGILRRLSATIISSMVSALLFCVAFTYPEKVFAIGENSKGVWSTGVLQTMPSAGGAGMHIPGGGNTGRRVITVPPAPGAQRLESEGGVRLISFRRLSSSTVSSQGMLELESQMTEVNLSDEELASQSDQISLSVYEAPSLSPAIAEFVDDLPHDQKQLFLTLMDDETSAVLLMMAAQNPLFVETIRHFGMMPEGMQREYLQSQHPLNDAISKTPRAYRGLHGGSDIDDLPLSATLEESARRVLYDRNSRYISYLSLNLIIWAGTSVAAAAQASVIPAMWQKGAKATIFESDMAATCSLVADGHQEFRLQGPLVGGLSLSSQALLNSACAGIGIAALPWFSQNIFMPMVMVGVLSIMKLAHSAEERRSRGEGMDSSTRANLERTVALLRQRLNKLDGDKVDIEELILSVETREALEEIIKKPGDLLPVAVGISRLKEEDDLEKVNAAVIAITDSLGEEITESKWQARLKHLLDIEPYKGGQPHTSGLANALYNIFKDRKTTHIYAPLVLGFLVAIALDSSVAVSVGMLAPHIAVVGDGAEAIIAPTSNLTLLCQTLNLTGSGLVGASVNGTVVQAGGSGLGTLLNIVAASFVAGAMKNIYEPIQRVCTSYPHRFLAWVSRACCGNNHKDKKEEEDGVLLRVHSERMPENRTRSLRQRKGAVPRNWEEPRYFVRDETSETIGRGSESSLHSRSVIEEGSWATDPESEGSLSSHLVVDELPEIIITGSEGPPLIPITREAPGDFSDGRRGDKFYDVDEVSEFGDIDVVIEELPESPSTPRKPDGYEPDDYESDDYEPDRYLEGGVPESDF